MEISRSIHWPIFRLSWPRFVGQKASSPIVPFDLSAGAKSQKRRENDWKKPSELGSRNSELGRSCPITRRAFDKVEKLMQELLARTYSEDSGKLWERLIETPGMLADPESIRRAALLFGWAVREDSSSIPLRDLLRESAMRQAIREAPEHSVALIGSFHASALLPSVMIASKEHDQFVLDLIQEDMQSVGVSLVGYSFEQLDERSGYPAGNSRPGLA